jgi:hypothetical protein
MKFSLFLAKASLWIKALPSLKATKNQFVFDSIFSIDFLSYANGRLFGKKNQNI